MRADNTYIWNLWNQGGPFIGDNKANAVVTVEEDWWLMESKVINGISQGGTYGPVPIRAFQREDNLQRETSIPNVQNIHIERSVDTDAASATITISNQWMINNTGFNTVDQRPEQLGQPGYFTPTRGDELRNVVGRRRYTGSQHAFARWWQRENEWNQVLVPNALLRTYQGYGGHDKTREEAIEDGNLVQTGVWMVDRVRVGTDGQLTLECRDVLKLLLDQQLYPPLMPTWKYPLQYCRWRWENKKFRIKLRDEVFNQSKRLKYRDSSVDRWYGANSVLHGHKGTDAVDGDLESFWLGEGNSHPSRPFAVNWIEFDCDEEINIVEIHPWRGPYTVYISIMEDGEWEGFPGVTVPYEHEPLIGNQLHVVDTGADIPWVHKQSIGPDGATAIKLKRKFRAQRVRLTFRDLKYTQWGRWHYRAGVRHAKVYLSYKEAVYEEETRLIKTQGNYKDYSDIVKELLLWGGFWLYPAAQSGLPPGYLIGNQQPSVYGNIESTGAWAEECLPQENFDKRPIIDAIHSIKDIVGYHFWADEEGAAHFESPNWWKPGNFDIDGTRVNTIPEIDERHNLLTYGVQFSDQAARSEIIISTEEPTQYYESTVTTRFKPPTRDILRGMIKPAMWINGTFTSKAEQKIMAELIALQIFFRQRTGSVQCVGNPCLSINDQVRILERQTSEGYIHYVRGISSDQNLESGEYTMSLTTHWLGDKEKWAVSLPGKPLYYQRYYVVQAGETWDTLLASLFARYKQRWTQEFILWTNQEQFQDTGGELLEGMILKV